MSVMREMLIGNILFPHSTTIISYTRGYIILTPIKHLEIRKMSSFNALAYVESFNLLLLHIFQLDISHTISAGFI